MGLLDKVREDAQQRVEERRDAKAAAAAHQASLPRWEYRVKWIGEDKQKGLLGAGRMETIFNEFGAEGWELVAINMERAAFKRPAG